MGPPPPGLATVSQELCSRGHSSLSSTPRVDIAVPDRHLYDRTPGQLAVEDLEYYENALARASPASTARGRSEPRRSGEKVRCKARRRVRDAGPSLRSRNAADGPLTAATHFRGKGLRQQRFVAPRLR